MANARIYDYKRSPSSITSTLDGASTTIDISVPNNSVMGFEIHIVVKGTANIGGYFVVNGAINNNAGTVALIGSPVVITPFLSASLALITAVATANSTNLRITLTGVAAIGTLEWQYEIKVIIN